MKHLASLLLCAWISPLLAAPKPAEPLPAATAFYRELRTLPVDGLPKGDAWKSLKALITPELAQVIELAQAEQAAAIKKEPDEKPPWVEGDLFSSLFEGPNSFKFGSVTISGAKAEVIVHCSYTGGGATSSWTDTLLLVKSDKGWLVDDIRFGGTWDFANKGTLKESFGPEH
jgi:hypothetical protein